MKYILLRRKKSVYADSATDFVTWMRKNDLQTCSNNAEFMQLYAYRKRTFEKIIICSDTEELFVDDLKKHNLLLVENKAGGILRLFR